MNAALLAALARLYDDLASIRAPKGTSETIADAEWSHTWIRVIVRRRVGGCAWELLYGSAPSRLKALSKGTCADDRLATNLRQAFVERLVPVLVGGSARRTVENYIADPRSRPDRRARAASALFVGGRRSS